jgi:outer membrane protein assembly factor BamB
MYILTRHPEQQEKEERLKKGKGNGSTVVPTLLYFDGDGEVEIAVPASAQFYMFDTDGTELWRLDLGEDLTASPVYAQGRIIIAGGDGTLFVISENNP